MSLPPLATVAALEVRLGVPVGSLAGDDLTRAGAALDDASALVRDEGLPWVADDGVTVTAPAVVVVVVLRVALRQYNNPDGYAGENVGTYSYQYSREASSLYLTDGERTTVRRAAGKATGGNAMSIRTPSAYSSPTPAGTPYGELPL